jgi:hypothetical protein
LWFYSCVKGGTSAVQFMQCEMRCERFVWKEVSLFILKFTRTDWKENPRVPRYWQSLHPPRFKPGSRAAARLNLLVHRQQRTRCNSLTYLYFPKNVLLDVLIGYQRVPNSRMSWRTLLFSKRTGKRAFCHAGPSTWLCGFWKHYRILISRWVHFVVKTTNKTYRLPARSLQTPWVHVRNTDSFRHGTDMIADKRKTWRKWKI